MEMLGFNSVGRSEDLINVTIFFLIPFTDPGKSSSIPICWGKTVTTPCGVLMVSGLLTLSLTSIFNS